MSVPISPATGGRAAILAACVVVSLGGATGGARAEDTFARLQGLLSGYGETYYVARPTIELELDYEVEDEARTSQNTRSREIERTFTRSADIETEGWIYHPGLVVFSLGLNPEWKTEETAVKDGLDREDKQAAFDFFIDTTWFQFRPLTFNLYSQRRTHELDSELSEDTTTESSVSRFRATSKNPDLPTVLTLETRAIDTEGLFDSSENTNLVNIETTRSSGNGRTRLEAEYQQQERTISQAASSVDRYMIEADSRYDFGENENVQWVSNLRAQDMSTSGQGSQTNVSVSGSFMAQHTPSLRSDYRYRVETSRTGTFYSNTVGGSARLTHRLYENLVTTFGPSFTNVDFTSGAIKTREVELGFDYRRRIPWGQIQIDNGYRYRLEDDKTDAVFTQVLDESVVLDGTETTYLAKRNPDTTTIVVTDSTGLVVFTEGVDYVVVKSGNLVGLARTFIGSAIADGATVLVDYQFTPDAPHKVAQTTVTYGVSLGLFEMLRLFYSANRTWDNLISGVRPLELANDLTRRMGAEFQWRWSTTRVEFEDRQSTRIPQTEWTFEESILYRATPDFSIGLDAAYIKTHATDTGELTETKRYSANFRWRPTRRTSFEALGRSTNIGGDLRDTLRHDLELKYRWRFGLWSGSIEYEIQRDKDRINRQSRNRQDFFIRLVRQL